MPGIKSFFNSFLTEKGRQLIIPDYFISSILEIDFKLLKENGFEYVLFDKDNTITKNHKKEISDEILLKIKESQNYFGYENIIIYSNSIGSNDDRDYKKAEKFEEKWNIKVANHKIKKPDGFDEVIDKSKFV